MMNPSAMRKLFPDIAEERLADLRRVDKDAVYLLPNSQARDPAQAHARRRFATTATT